MTNTLWEIEKQNEDWSNKISQLETCLTANLDEFKHYIHQAIPAYTEQEEIGLVKSEIETLKEEKSKLRHAMYEKNYINETSDGNIKQRKGQTETRQTLKHQSTQSIPLDTRNRLVLLQNV